MAVMQTAVVEIFSNIGFSDPSISATGIATVEAYANVGFPSATSDIAVAEIMGNVGAQPPTSSIYGTIPKKVRTGDNATIVAVGVGQTRANFNPVVQGQLTDGSWANIPIESYSNIPASADAFTADRQISEDLSTVDCEHQRVGIVVPAWAAPPELPLRIVQSDGNSVTGSVHSAVSDITANIT